MRRSHLERKRHLFPIVALHRVRTRWSSGIWHPGVPPKPANRHGVVGEGRERWSEVECRWLDPGWTYRELPPTVVPQAVPLDQTRRFQLPWVEFTVDRQKFRPDAFLIVHTTSEPTNCCTALLAVLPVLVHAVGHAVVARPVAWKLRRWNAIWNSCSREKSRRTAT
jgi:hypothetical protein